MNIRRNKSQALAAAKAGISDRSARRIEVAVELPSQSPRRGPRALDTKCDVKENV